MNVRAFALLVLVGFVTVGVFGFAGMSHDTGHNSGCIAITLSNSVVCPQDALSSALYHIAAYQSFSQTTITSLSFSALALLILLAALFAVRKRLLPIPSVPLYVLSKRRDDISLSCREEFLRRLSLFENSPSRFCSA